MCLANVDTVHETLNIYPSLTGCPRLVRIPFYVNYLSVPGGLNFGMTVPSSLPSYMLPYSRGKGTL